MIPIMLRKINNILKTKLTWKNRFYSTVCRPLKNICPWVHMRSRSTAHTARATRGPARAEGSGPWWGGHSPRTIACPSDRLPPPVWHRFRRQFKREKNVNV